MYLKHSLIALGFILASAASAQADIFRWDNGQLIPGTEGITPGPGVQLDHRELEYAALGGQDLTNSRFDFSNLTYAYLGGSTLTNANMTDAVVYGAKFSGATFRGFTKEQLYSTASYKVKNLSGIGFGFWRSPSGDEGGHGPLDDLTGWNLAGQNLVGAGFGLVTLTGADLSQANLTGVYFANASLLDAKLSDAVVTGANFAGATYNGFTKEQLYSTASYKAKDLRGISLYDNDLSGWDFSGQDLTNAQLSNSPGDFVYPSELTNANLAGTVVTGANFAGTTYKGFTKEQLYATASYQQKNLQGIGLNSNDLSGWDFSGQNLANATFTRSTLTNANLTGANLTNAYLHNSTLTNANLTGAETRGAQGLDLTGATSRNAILPDGAIAGLNLAAGDQLVVRNYPLPVTIQDHITMASGGALKLLFDADPWDSLISFQPGIPVTLGGTLELLFATDVELASQVGRTFDVFDWTGVNPTGQFQFASPYAWNLSNLHTTGEVTLTAVPEPAGVVLMGVCLVALAAIRLVRRWSHIRGKIVVARRQIVEFEKSGRSLVGRSGVSSSEYAFRPASPV